MGTVSITSTGQQDIVLHSFLMDRKSAQGKKLCLDYSSLCAGPPRILEPCYAKCHIGEGEWKGPPGGVSVNILICIMSEMFFNEPSIFFLINSFLLG